jgi:hypothetical protein
MDIVVAASDSSPTACERCLTAVMRRRPNGAIAVVVFFVSGCTGTVRLPTGVGTPNVPETLRVAAAVSQRCSEIEPWSAAIALDGTIAGRSVRRQLLGVFSRSKIRLEAVSRSGEPPFVLVSDGGRTILRAAGSPAFQVSDSRDAMQALIGVRMPADVLGRTLVACELPDGFGTMRVFGSRWARLPSAGGSIYLHRTNTTGPWQPVTMFYAGETLHWAWRVDYQEVQNGIPVRMHLLSADGRVDMQFRLSQVDTMVWFPSNDVRFRIDPLADTRTGSPEQLRDVIYQSFGDH